MGKRIDSIRKKIANINAAGIVEGVISKATGSMDAVARERAKICAGCDMNQPEPIDELAIRDDIAEISERYCEACGCALPYLLRQNRKKCKLGKW